MELKKNVLETLLQAINYLPHVYQQVDGGSNNSITIKYPFTEVPSDSLLFVLPTRNMTAATGLGVKNTLTIYLPQVEIIEGEKKVTHSSASQVTYEIVTETNEGSIKPVQANQILANRVAIFRFIKRGTVKAVLMNSPLHGSIDLNELLVTNQARFRQLPIYSPDPEDSTKDETFVPRSDYNKLLQRVEALESKFLFGEDDPEVALEGKPDGTIYIKVDKY